MTSKFRIITLSSVVLLACATPNDTCGCSPLTFQTHFVGFVADGNGPVGGARVTASIFMEDCQAAATTVVYLAHNGAVVDSAGRYRFELRLWRPDTLCARLVARAASDSFVRDTVPVIVLGGDSVRVDFTFP